MPGKIRFFPVIVLGVLCNLFVILMGSLDIMASPAQDHAPSVGGIHFPQFDGDRKPPHHDKLPDDCPVVNVYITGSDCPSCQMAMAHLRQFPLKVHVQDVDLSDEARKRLMQLSGKTIRVPLVEFMGLIEVGYEGEALDAFIKKSAY